MFTVPRLRVASAIVAFFAASVWLGGLLVLGAIVAPIVFREVPAPTSGDAMTRVFVAFDKLAMSAAALIAVSEVVRMRLTTSAPSRLDAARLGAVVAAGLCAIVQGLYLSPTIVDLHQRGAVRGLGELGESLERAHAWSERTAKTELLLVAIFIGLLTYSLSHSDRAAGPSD
jgi:uncharacterized membrane protein